jgi:hypothetical protein
MTDKKQEDKDVMEVLPPPSDAYIAQAEAKSLEFMNPKRWTVMQHMAQTFINSGAVPESIKNAAQMIMVFQAGYEAGMQPLEALSAFYIVNGKITMYGDAVTSQIIKAGHIVEWDKKCDDKFARVTITRGDNSKSMIGEFTIEKAIERGLTTYNDGRPNKFWQKYPENMLKYKALGTIADFIVPDALHGASIKENIESEVDVTSADRATTSSDAAQNDATPVSAPDENTHTSLDETLASNTNQTDLEKWQARAERLEELGLVWKPKANSWVKADFNVGRAELMSLSDEEFDKVVADITNEMQRREASKHAE